MSGVGTGGVERERAGSIIYETVALCTSVRVSFAYVHVYPLRDALLLLHTCAYIVSSPICLSHNKVGTGFTSHVRLFWVFTVSRGQCMRYPLVIWRHPHPAWSCYKPGRVRAATQTYINLYIGQSSLSMLTAAAPPYGFASTLYNWRWRDGNIKKVH